MEFIRSLTPEVLLANPSATLENLQKDENWQNIPLVSQLNSFDHLNEMQLVRFRGLVQDMHDPQIYLEQFQTKNALNELKTYSAKFKENIKLEENEEFVADSSANVHKERRTMFMVSIPGLNEWAVEIEKRSEDSIPNNGNSVEPSSGVKRPLDENEEAMELDTTNTNSAKKPINDSTQPKSEQKGLSKEFLLNSPIADRPSKAFLVKFYEDSSDLSLNDVIEVVGFISLDPSLCGSNQKPNEFENFDEVCAMNPPPSLIPRIHAITFRPLKHLNPIVHGCSALLNLPNREEVLKDLRIILSQCLLGDTLAADYLLCHLISTVYVRGEETLGQFSINLMNFPSEILPNYTKQLYEIIELLLPASHYFPVTLDNLNDTDFIPSKDYTTGKLTSGLLQLAPHTHLVMDETRLQPGKLESRGIESVMHISNLIRNQKLNVNFKFYQIDYSSNVPVLVLSEGKSMFPTNCQLPIMGETDSIRLINETFVALKQFIKPKLESIRIFLTECRLKEFNMDPTDMSMIQNDFVNMRRDFNATAEDLHALLILSRMLGIIQGKSSLDADCWTQAKQMEEERRKRINQLPKK